MNTMVAAIPVGGRQCNHLSARVHHMTAVPGISRSDALRIIGDGVCPQQAVAAIRHLMPFTGVQ